MRFPRNSGLRVRAALDMTSMVNVVLLLLLFFMLTSSFVVQSSVPIELIQSEGAAQMERRDMTITLAVGDGGPDNGGNVYVEEAPVKDWADLRGALMELKNKNPEALVMVRPDKNVPAERLMRVLGIANGTGITHYGIAAQQPVAPRGE